MPLSKKRAQEQKALIRSWEEFMGIDKAVTATGQNKSTFVGYSKLGLSYKTWWRYKHAINAMPVSIKHAMSNVAHGFAPWGEE